jgi:hypothetical protein
VLRSGDSFVRLRRLEEFRKTPLLVFCNRVYILTRGLTRNWRKIMAKAKKKAKAKAKKKAAKKK